MDDLISKLSEIRSEYNCFDEDEEPYYRALSEAIMILSQRADEDTISRQTALNALCTPNGILYPIRTIENLPSAQSEIIRWIPCTERMPEEETDVLVCNANGDIEISSGSYSTEAKDFIWYTSGWRFGKVIAWMPLPEPYTESEEV